MNSDAKELITINFEQICLSRWLQDLAYRLFQKGMVIEVNEITSEKPVEGRKDFRVKIRFSVMFEAEFTIRNMPCPDSKSPFEVQCNGTEILVIHDKTGFSVNCNAFGDQRGFVLEKDAVREFRKKLGLII
jgi:hypothetical protein